MTFNADQAGMAIFLLFAVIANAWFVVKSSLRAFSTNNNDSLLKSFNPNRQKLLQYAVLAMALFDIPWVWLCMIQCWNNMLTEENDFHQSSGDDSFGCKFMGFYSSFSLVSMMGSHCLVVFYLMNMLNKNRTSDETKKSFFADTTGGLVSLAALILVTAVLFGLMPLMQGDGYRLTNGGFCYADFTNKAQSSVILSLVVVFLLLATLLWIKIGQWKTYWLNYAIFVATWILWIPATSYGIATGNEIASPYMIIGAILGHGNAIINPVLYGVRLWLQLHTESIHLEQDGAYVGTSMSKEVEP